MLLTPKKGSGLFLGVAVPVPAGVARFSFRMRIPQAGEGRVVLLAAADAAEHVSATYSVRGGSAWQNVTVDLQVTQKTNILRLYLPEGSDAVELDDIVLTLPEGEHRRWGF